MKKTVAIVGVFTPGSSNNGVARAFERLGWEVKRLPYREFASKIGVDSASALIINAVSFINPDLVLFCKFNGFNSDIVKECSNISKTCLWFMDSFNIVRSNCPEIISHCHNASFSIHWPGVADKFKELGVKNCFGIVEGCDEEEFRPVESVNKYTADISFIGTKNHRHSIVELLESFGYVVKCYGHGYDEYVTGDEFNSVCCSSKMVINIPTFIGERDYFSDRLVRTLATGTCSLTLYTEGMEKYFDNEKHLVWFKDGDNIGNIVKSSIYNYKNIGMAGREHFLNNYTCKHFVKKMLEFGNL